MRGEKYYGTYTPVSAIPILHLRDLDLMQHVMGKQKVYLISGWILLFHLKMNFLASVKDFNYFVDRTFNGYDLGRGTSYTDQIWKAQMLGLKGDKWREVRATFSPIFTSGKMKMMMRFMTAISDEMEAEFALGK